MLAITGLAGSVALAGALALSGGGAIFAQTGTPTPASNAGGPSAVPSARFFGTVTSSTGSVQGATVTASIGGVTCGTGTVSGGQYTVDIQAISGCTTPGASVSFSVNGQPASQTGQLPQVQGTAVPLNLTIVAATPTPAPTTAPTPPPPPTTRPSTPPPPPTTRPTTAPTVAPTAVVPSRPPQTGLGCTSQQKPVAPSAQKPAAPAAPVSQGAVVVLPNTGTGGSATGGSLAGLLAILAALGMSGVGALVLARRRA